MAPTLVCVAAVAGLLVCERRGARAGIAVFKLLAAASFLAAALAFGALASDYGRIVFVGLALSAAGDALLLPPGRGGWFRAGIGAFLCGHVAYAIAFLGQPQHPVALAVGAAAMVAAGLLTLRWLRPRVPADLTIAVVAYVVVIGTMVAVATGAVGGGANPAVVVGAVAFAASDLSVARERFVSPGFVNAAWGLPLYFAAQLVLASTVADHVPHPG